MADLRVGIRIGAQDRASDALDRVAAGSSKLERRLSSARRELAGFDSRDASVRKLASLETGLGKTAAKMDDARRRTAELRRQLREATGPTASLERQFEAARRKSSALSQSHRRQRQELRELREQLRGAGIDTRRLGDAQRDIATDIERATRRMDRMRDAASRVSAAQERLDRSSQRAARGALVAGELRNVGRGILQAVAAPIGRSREAERSRGDLASLGVSPEDVRLVSGRGRELSRLVAGITEPVFTAAAYDIRSGIAALDGAGVAEFTELAGLTAAATKAELGQMTSLFATAYGAFKEPLFGGVSDVQFGEAFAAQLAKSVEAFKTDGSKMQQAIESMGSGLAASGVSLEEQLAALGMLQQKMPAGRAGTVMQALERSAADAQKRFSEQGVRIRTLDAQGNMLAPSDLLRQMQEEFGEAYTTAAGAEIKQAFGSDEAKEFFSALWGQGEALEAAAESLAAAGGEGREIVRAMQRLRQDNLDDRLTLLQQRWDRLNTIIGDRLGPTLDWAGPKLGALVDGIADFADRHPEFTAGVAAVTGGVGLLALAAAPAIIALGSLRWAIDRLRLGAARKAFSAAAAGGSAGIPAGAGGGAPRRGPPAAPGAAPPGKGKLPGRFGDFARGAGRRLRLPGLAGAGIGALVIGSTLLNEELSSKEKVDAVTSEAGGIAGGIAGMAAGAAIGSVVPIIGTAVGGILGGILGGFGGSGLARLGLGILQRGSGARADEPGRRSFRELRGLPPTGPAVADDSLVGPPAPAPEPAAIVGPPAPEQGLVPALVRMRREQREAAQAAQAAQAAAATGDRSVSITNRIVIEQRDGESWESLTDRMIQELERRQALAGREALADAY